MSKEVNIGSNESLIQALHDAASDLSFYNAGEGETYRYEAGARGVAKARWYALVEEATRRGVYNPEDFRNYLV